jgi:hypothetical protein
MPAVLIKNQEDYVKIIEVLHRMGGTWQGVAREEKMYLLVSPSHYKALVEAKAVTPEDQNKDAIRGKKARKTSKS